MFGGKFRSSFEDHWLWITLNRSSRSPQLLRQSCLVDSQFRKKFPRWNDATFTESSKWRVPNWAMPSPVRSKWSVPPSQKLLTIRALLVLVGGGDRVAVPQRITNDTVQLVSSTVRWWLVENSPFLVYEGPLGRSQERRSPAYVHRSARRRQELECSSP